MSFTVATLGRGHYLRPTRVIPGRMGGTNISVEIKGLRELERIPEQLQGAYDRMIVRLAEAAEKACAEVVPGGASGTLGRQVKGRVLSRTDIVIGTVGSAFAKALDRGFTSKPKHAKALRFDTEGKLVFTMRSRVAGRHFFEKWLAIVPPLIEAIYDQEFYDVKHLRYG
jgi:hypothetical protein